MKIELDIPDDEVGAFLAFAKDRFEGSVSLAFRDLLEKSFTILPAIAEMNTRLTNVETYIESAKPVIESIRDRRVGKMSVSGEPVRRW